MLVKSKLTGQQYMFPDDMDQGQIAQAIRQAEADQEVPDYSPMGRRVPLREYLQGLGESAQAFGRQATSAMLGLPGEIESLVRLQNPLQAGRFASGQPLESTLPQTDDIRPFVDKIADDLIGEQTSKVIGEGGREAFEFMGDVMAPLGIQPTKQAIDLARKAPVGLLNMMAEAPQGPRSQLGMIAPPVLQEMKKVKESAKKDSGLLDLTTDANVSFANRNTEVKARILDPLRVQAMGGFENLGEKASVLDPGTPLRYRKPKKKDGVTEKLGRNITTDKNKLDKPYPYGRYKIKPINVYSMPGQYKTIMEGAGMGVPKNLIQVSPDEAGKFIKHLNDAKGKTPYAAAVETHSEDYYKNTKMFLTEDGKAGFALNGDEIVSVFSDGTHKGISPYLMISAIDLGGRKLDNFDDALTKLYSTVGFRQSANLPFNREFAPDDWDYDLLGEPDVTSMYQSAAKAEPQFGGVPVQDYDELMAVRGVDMQNQPPILPTEMSYIPIDVQKTGDNLRLTMPDATPFSSKQTAQGQLTDLTADFKIASEIPEKKILTLDDAEDMLIGTYGYDRINNNVILQAINGKPLKFPVPITGGQGYLPDPRTQGVMAVLDDKRAEDVRNRYLKAMTAAGKDEINFAPFVMGRDGLDFSKDTFRTLFSYNLGNMTEKGLKMFDEHLTSKINGFKDVSGFKGINFENPQETLRFIESLPSENRKTLFKTAGLKDLLDEGAIDPSAVRAAITDPDTVNKQIRQLHNVARMDPRMDRVPSAHETYRADALPGQYVGTFDNLRIDEILNPVPTKYNPNADKNRGLLDIIEQGGFHRAVEMSGPITHIDNELLRFIEMRRNDPETPLSELYRLHGLNY